MQDAKGHASDHITSMILFLRSTFQSFTNLPVSFGAFTIYFFTQTLWKFCHEIALKLKSTLHLPCFCLVLPME